MDLINLGECRRVVRAPCLRGAFAVLYLCMASSGMAQVNVLTANYDNYRTSANLNETTLTPSNVNTGSFGKLGAVSVDGQIYAQPLFVSGLALPGVGTKNVVYVVTMHNSVYAIDADAPTSSTPLWKVNLGPSVPSKYLGFDDIDPEVGILSTPVIDLARQAIYVVSESLDSAGNPQLQMHALSLLNGSEILNGPVPISASASGWGVGTVDGTVTFDPTLQLQRPGLALSKGMIIASFASHGDNGNFHGWVIAYDATDLRHRIASLNTTPSGWGGGIWQTGRAPAIDDAGNIYVVTGNGDFDGMTDFGGVVLKLSGKDLSILDWYAPSNWNYLDENDADLGSVGPILIPGSGFLVTGDKVGTCYLLNTGSLGHLDPGDGSIAQSFVASPSGIYHLALWNSNQGMLLYNYEQSGPLDGYQIAGGSMNTEPVSQSHTTGDIPYEGVTVSANAGTNGIVWVNAGDFSQPVTPGSLHAFNALDLTQELWNSDMQPGQDALGRFAKFANPTVANGRVYVPTFSNQLAIYGLLPPGGVQTAPLVAAVSNGASFTQEAVSPGEIVALFGADLGPDAVTSSQFDASGKIPTLVGGAQVTFDGIPSPLLYSSSGQVGAVVPYGVNAPTTLVQVQYAGQSSIPAALPVSPATPALFSLDGSGVNQGAILNQDGSLNGASNPATPGSVVVLFGTGVGQTNPPGVDGSINSGALPVPVLPVAFMVDGQPAEVLYAGAAPTLVAGVFQFNVRIPDNVSSGDIWVYLGVGDASSQDGLTVNVQPTDGTATASAKSSYRPNRSRKHGKTTRRLY